MPSFIILSSFCLILRRVVAHKTYYTPGAASCSTFAYAFDLHPHHRREITLKQYHHPYYNPNPLLDFYRANFHESPSKKLVPSLPKKAGEKISDVMYILTSSHQDQDEIMAALRLTKSKNDEKYTFLRSLCVARKYRRCGLATILVNESLQHFDVHYCYCFASPDLTSFYQKLGFTLASSMQGEAQPKFIPRWMVNSYESMSNRSRKELKLYIKQEPSSSGANIPDGKNNLTEIVLLQHYTEKSKQTATGWLLNDTQYSEYFGIDASMSDDDFVESKMKLTLWPWGGSNDIAMIEDQINRRLKDNNRTVYLLWTGGGGSSANNVVSSERNSCESKVGETYIVIDGTWQQAKKIYRKVRALWALPRVSFLGTDVPTSKYFLRGDYSGWRERFSSNSEEDGSGLLCTAEVAAAVMDKCGDISCGNLIRSRLDAFQSSFSQRQKKKFRGNTEKPKMRAKLCQVKAWIRETLK